jgi:hypothetical protein
VGFEAKAILVDESTFQVLRHELDEHPAVEPISHRH